MLFDSLLMNDTLNINMDRVEKNNIVTIHYTLTFTDGRIYDTSPKGKPVTFELGKNLFFPGLESMIEGMFIGQIKKGKISCNDALGPKLDSLITQVPLSTVPKHIKVHVGNRVEINVPPKIVATIIAVTKDTIELDGNPNGAGEDFMATIELVDFSQPKDHPKTPPL